MTSRILEWLKTEWERWGMKNYDRIEKFWVWHTEEESEVWNPIIIFGGWPKKKVRSRILSSFLAGDQKRKLGQEFYHHSWRVTHKQFEVRNPIIIISKNKKVLACKIAQKESEVRNSFIILGGWSKKKVRSGILSSFLTVDPKSKWHLES